MSDETKAVVNGFYKGIFQDKDLAAIDTYLHAGFVDHNMMPGQGPGLDGAKEVLGMYITAFPDLSVTTDWQISEGDMVVTRITFNGTNTGEMMGMPATNKKVTFTGMDAVRIADGKITEHWGNEDSVGMMQQMGLIPTE